MILRKGSKGPEVKILQEFLNDNGFQIAVNGPGSPGKETDNFGPGTEAAVKRWQKANGLKDDGVVGPVTWNAMGLATTDVSESQPKPSGILEIKKQFLPKGEFLAGPTKKDWVFLHHTAGWENPYNTISAWARDTRGAIGTEFVLGGPKITDGNIAFDGELVQAFPTGGYGWHLGTGNNVMHRNSVGIEVCNFGYLTLGGYWKWNATTKKNEWIKLKADRLYTYVGTEVNPASNQVVTLAKEFRGHRTWHRYSDTQIEVIKEWLLFIADRDGIDIRKGLPELIRQKGADAFDFFNPKYVEANKGLWSHTNVRKDKVDMFPQQELIDMLLSL
jgi:Putative peptidoglycan binding domain/N-acetylmuramoyl-L-alanine amidase